MKYKIQTTEKPAKYHLRPVLCNDLGETQLITAVGNIEIAKKLIGKALNNLSDCEGKDALKKCDTLLWAILTDNE